MATLREQTGKNGAWSFRRLNGFTLIELLVVLVIIALLTSLLLPTLSRAKKAAHLTRCRNNVRQLALALNLYMIDFGVYPQLSYWFTPAPVGFVNWNEEMEPYTSNRWTKALYKRPEYRSKTTSGVAADCMKSSVGGMFGSYGDLTLPGPSGINGINLFSCMEQLPDS